MKILLIRLRLIGDVVFTTPIPRALKRAYPGAHLTYVVEEAALPVVAGNPHLDAVIVAARPGGLRRLAADLALARRLRRERFDIAIDFHGGPRSSWLTLATGARQRIGRSTGRARSGPATPSTTNGTCSRRLTDGPPAGRIRCATASRCRSIPRPMRGSRGGCPRPVSAIDTRSSSST
ncbi:MAG: hypothetical protein A3G21_23450 [Acidobacteria bacterium RIFCSPLOWO2_12_FULL_66_21]|nr:MAG: hypothetical protein A3G21_23450 [Acidobacteria bacterium RIFCSPLOWO2_12_FULL_66_21]